VSLYLQGSSKVIQASRFYFKCTDGDMDVGVQTTCRPRAADRPASFSFQGPFILRQSRERCKPPDGSVPYLAGHTDASSRSQAALTDDVHLLRNSVSIQTCLSSSPETPCPRGLCLQATRLQRKDPELGRFLSSFRHAFGTLVVVCCLFQR